MQPLDRSPTQPNNRLDINITHKNPDNDSDNDRQPDALYLFVNSLVGFTDPIADLIRFTAWTGGSGLWFLSVRSLLTTVIAVNPSIALVGLFVLLIPFVLLLLQLREAHNRYTSLRFRLRVFGGFCVGLGFAIGVSDIAARTVQRFLN